MRRRTTLRRRLAVLIATACLLSLLVFSAVAYLGIYLEEETELDLIPEADDDATAFLVLTFGLAAPICLAVTLSGSLWLARRWIRPIEEVIRAAGEMSVDELDRRLPVPRADDELRDMVRTLNELFARLEDGFEGLHSFAASVSHELRTPLAIAISELEVAARRPRSDEEWRESAGHVLVSLRRLVQLVEALLELARGGIAGPRDEVDLSELAEEVVSTFAERAEQTGLALIHTSREAAPALVSRGAITAALSALVANALRYTPPGGRVEVSAEVEAGGGAARHVDDSGPGVSEEARALVFEPLQRGAAGREADRRAEEAGLGLGLAIVSRVIEQHGGSVDVGRSPLAGARFTLRLPPPGAARSS